MSYYSLVLSRSLKETNRLWNAHKVWGLASGPISGFALGVLTKGRLRLTSSEGVLFIGFGFIVSWAGTYLINLIRIPCSVHRGQCNEISDLRLKMAALEEKGRLSPADQHNFNTAKKSLERLPDKSMAIEVLRDLRNRESIAFGHFPPTVPPGIDFAGYEKICWECEKVGILIGDNSRPGYKIYSIAPGMKTPLEKLLFSDE